MNCSPSLIEAYLDQELDPVERGEVEQHVAGCPDCAEALQHLREQQASIRATAPYYNAPPDLRRAIRSSLRRESSQKPAWRQFAIAASVLLAVSLSWNVLQFRTGTTRSDLAEDVVADHVRSLLGTHLVDVPSSDQHTVKPWFAGKLDFAPVVKDLGDAGFPLVGGRGEYLAGRRVAALVYRRRQHVINLFTWPAPSGTADATVTRDGYNVLHWVNGGMNYWVISDVSLPEIEHFRDLYKQ